MDKLWNRWKKISAKILDKEARLILSILYFVLVAPFALILKTFANPLNLKSKSNSFWFEKETDNVSGLEALKRQY